MEKHEIESMAASLYDGGWRSVDEEELKKEYDLTKDEVSAICDKLAEYQFNESKETLISKWQVVLQVTDKSGEVTKEDILATADTEEEAIELVRDYWFATCKSDQEKSKIFAALIHPTTGDWAEVAAEFNNSDK